MRMIAFRVVELRRAHENPHVVFRLASFCCFPEGSHGCLCSAFLEAKKMLQPRRNLIRLLQPRAVLLCFCLLCVSTSLCASGLCAFFKENKYPRAAESGAIVYPRPAAGQLGYHDISTAVWWKRYSSSKQVRLKLFSWWLVHKRGPNMCTSNRVQQ